MSEGRRPIRVLELRSVWGTGGGPEKTILLGAERSDPEAIRVTICYLRLRHDDVFAIDRRAAAIGVDYVEVQERHSFDPAVYSSLRRLVRERQIDIVHAHEYKTDLIALLLARSEGVIPLATVHGWTGHTFRERWVYYPADRFLLARFPRLIAVSSEIQRTLVGAGARPDRISTILNGIDHRAFRRDRSREAVLRRDLGITSRDIVVGTIGRLEPQKRVDLLLDAVAELRSSRPEIRLVVVGDGSVRGELETRAEIRLPDGGCLFLGHRTDIADLHHVFDLFVQSSDYEGTPNAVLEAMAMETPVVATDAGGTRELVEPGVHGLIVPCGDAHVLAAAMGAALSDPEGTAVRAAAARHRIEHTLSFEARMRKVEAIYADLMNDRPSYAGSRAECA